MGETQERTFESAFEALEEAVTKLEAGGLTLDESLALYAQARELADWCAAQLDEAELRVQQLTASGEVKPLE
jgi:exodeoxyribonuclease VII small subunit